MISETLISKTTVINNNGSLLNGNRKHYSKTDNSIPKILFISSYPPKECGIATYSQDLITALKNKFNSSFEVEICPLESNYDQYSYPEEVKYILNTNYPEAFITLAKFINDDAQLQLIVVQHEFGLYKQSHDDLIQLLRTINKPAIVVFHTVLPSPDEKMRLKVQQIANYSNSIVVMTNSSANILMNDYNISKEVISVIPHGTHLVSHIDDVVLKQQYHFEGRKILSTFGLLSSGKNIETTLDAMPAIIAKHPDVLFLIIGKTHPSVINNEGEKYRDMLMQKVEELQLKHHVKFINYFLPLTYLLEYLQLTDIYLFTSKDPNQAVSGTFSYALSCGCAVVSTPIPHALEVLKNDAGIIIDFENPIQLANVVNNLLNDEEKRKAIILNGLHKMATTAWENTALSHGIIFKQLSNSVISLDYKIPVYNLAHIKKMTSSFGIIQFSKINHPDITTGYTLDDNARAMIALCMHYELTGESEDLKYITIYFNFVKFCLQSKGFFLNYVDEKKQFTEQNNTVDLADSNGRAIWALGYLISISKLLPSRLASDAENTMQTALLNVKNIHSTRAMAFIIKGIYYRNLKTVSFDNTMQIEHFADRLIQMYRHESETNWLWFESYFTYGNSLLPEAMLCAWLATGKSIYKEVAKSSFDFLLSKIYKHNIISVISNKGWFNRGDTMITENKGGEQPIDVAYTILALNKFYDVFKDESYLNKMNTAFSWFLGNNHLQQIIYNPCTGGCYDGLEENYVNLNQGAESTVSYLMARLTIEQYSIQNNKLKKVESKYQELNHLA